GPGDDGEVGRLSGLAIPDIALYRAVPGAAGCARPPYSHAAATAPTRTELTIGIHLLASIETWGMAAYLANATQARSSGTFITSVIDRRKTLLGLGAATLGSWSARA